MKTKTYFFGRRLHMNRLAVVTVALLAMMAGSAAAGQPQSPGEAPGPAIVLAVEFNSHAACAHVARHKGLYEKEGIRLQAYDSYVTGMALAAGLARGDIDAAYICLIPAINVAVNGGVPLKVVAGTHKYGYALVVDSDKIQTPQDLVASGIRIGCAREGSPTDGLLHKIIDAWGLDARRTISNVRRMNPPKQLIALKAGRLDAAVVPEQYPRMAEHLGFRVLVTAQDVWPDMQGSVLVVTDDLIREHPDMVEKLVKVTRQATCWINRHPKEASDIVAAQLNATPIRIFPEKAGKLNNSFTVTPDVVMDSLTRGLVCTADVRRSDIEEAMEYMAKLGYIRRKIAPETMLDRRWLTP